MIRAFGLPLLILLSTSASAQFLSTEIKNDDDSIIAPPVLRRLQFLEHKLDELEKNRVHIETVTVPVPVPTPVTTPAPAPAATPAQVAEPATQVAPTSDRLTPTYTPFAMSFSLPPREEIPVETWHAAKANETITDLGPAASKLYFLPNTNGPIFGMQAEFLSFGDRRGLDSSGAKNPDRLNVATVAPVLGLRLHKRVLFNAQILFENGGAESSNTVTLQKGQAVVLQAYADWLENEKQEFGVRIGHQLIPIGTVNTSQEAATFFGVLRPELERELIPSTWHENGLSVWARRPSADLQLGLFNSLNAQGMRGETFLAGGRSNGQNAPAQDYMATARIKIKLPVATLGGSIAVGQSAQSNIAYRHGTFGVGEAHAKLNLTQRLELFAQFAQGSLMDADSISVVNSTSMGSKAKGLSGHLAFQVLHGKEQQLWLFARHSHYDLQDHLPTGFTRDNSLNKTQTTLGISFFPMPSWVVKADYAFKRSSAKDEEDEFNLGTGLSF